MGKRVIGTTDDEKQGTREGEAAERKPAPDVLTHDDQPWGEECEEPRPEQVNDGAERITKTGNRNDRVHVPRVEHSQLNSIVTVCRDAN